MSRLRPSVSQEVGAYTQPTSSSPPDQPRLLWPSIDYVQKAESLDLLHFPDANRVHWRRREGEGGTALPLVEFMSAVENSLERVLVLDLHFDKVGVTALAPALESSGAKDIRLLTGAGDMDKDEREKYRKRLEDYRNGGKAGSNRTQVRWSTRLNKHKFPFLHDRFAIIDGALWHFGSTVGGGYSGVTAASGPWSECDTQGKRFFDECWEKSHA